MAPGIDELVAKVKAQGIVVKDLKTAKADATAAVAELLSLKQALTALDPDHELAIKDKKKKESDKAKGAAGPSAKDLRKLEKEKAAQELAARKAASSAATADIFGDSAIIQSRELTDRAFVNIRGLTAALAGQRKWVRGRVHATRGKGKIAFLVLRQSCFTVQAVAATSGDAAVPKEMIDYMTKIPNESIVDVECTFAAPSEPITSCTQSNVELVLHKVFTISKALPDLPLQIADASRNEFADEEEASATGPVVGLDTRLNHRVIDLRAPANQAIFRIKSAITLIYTKYLDSKGFVGINTPKLLGGASEGGSSVFRLKYFERDACLAQSPQLYKQMTCACSDMERVYEVGPVFRAEDSNTRRHLCEFTGLDMEMAIYEHYYEVLDMFSGVFVHIFKTLQAEFADELKIISQTYPYEPFQFLEPSLRITFAEGIALLREAGVTEEEQGEFDDLSTAVEKKLGNIVKEKFGTDFFMMDKYPLSIRPFYTMPDPETAHLPPAQQLSNSFDMFMRGQEIVSGAQRVHDHAMLMERVNFCHGSAGHGGPAPESIKGYTDAFKYGAFPHGGGGVGLERVTMLFLDLTNIRKASYFPRDPRRIEP